jgi:DNA adenine methylase
MTDRSAPAPAPLAPLAAPFPWYGGKSRVARIIWERFGDVPNYVEPFAGSLAVLLGRPHPPRIETVNDLDCYIANFWRALAADPDGVARHADWPINEADLAARHRWLAGRAEFRERMLTDPAYYDVKIAGWWVWGLCAWIGGEWCGQRWWWDDRQPAPAPDGPVRQIPRLASGEGIHRASLRAADRRRQRPHLGNAGMGVHRAALRADGPYEDAPPLLSYLRALAGRLRHVRVCCGDWRLVLTDVPTVCLGTTAVLLDPPYRRDLRDANLYAVDQDVAASVAAWAREHGHDPRLRIALCGYAGEHAMPPDWSAVRWSVTSNGHQQDQARQECIWFSPHCLAPAAQQLALPSVAGA